MTKFTEEQKKFIVKAFGKSPSTSIVRREFIRQCKITGRQASKLFPHHFSRVNASFEKNGTIHRKARTTTPAPIKRSPEKIEEISSRKIKETPSENHLNWWIFQAQLYGEL